MIFSRDSLPNILPGADIPIQYVPEIVLSSLLQLREREGEYVYRAGVWTYAMFSEIRQGRVAFEPADRWPFPSWRYPIAIGILDLDFEGKGFGVIMLNELLLPSSGIIGQARFDRLGATVPVALRSLVEDLHAIPSASNAASACWAEDRSKRGQWGVLTCRHALSGVRPGATITLTNGATAKVERKAPATIEAAFLVTTAPALLTQMTLLRFATPSQTVRVLTASGLAQRSVVAVVDTLGVINDPYHPIKIYIDQPCQPGDSGALVDTSAGQGAGIYCGAMTNATVAGQSGQTVGFVQHLEQAVEILDLVPFQ